jgi:CheY-like chemotaxis protein
MLLIIEDNLEAVHLYKIALQLVQIEPVVETSGPAALRRIQEEGGSRPSAVILDMNLKKEDGVEVHGEQLFNVMRQAWPDTKIIVVSADLGWCQRFVDVADAVVEKPISNMQAFLDTILSFLNSGRKIPA